jgi:hypothetical protein
MTGREHNVGFLATESGLEQFRLSLWGCFVLKDALHNTGENPPYGMNRGGGENMGMTRGPFATMLERAHTGSHWSKPVAPPLHSTSGQPDLQPGPLRTDGAVEAIKPNWMQPIAQTAGSG